MHGNGPGDAAPDGAPVDLGPGVLADSALLTDEPEEPQEVDPWA